MIFDEPTSNLDEGTENFFIKNLVQQAKDKIIISNRFSVQTAQAVLDFRIILLIQVDIIQQLMKIML